jgi:ABC-type multidrug transport system fused ATPase/permease subunit
MGVLSTTMQESLTGIRVVKAFAREPYEFEKFDRDNSLWFRLREGVIRLWGNNWPFFTFLIALSNFLLLFFGGPMALRRPDHRWRALCHDLLCADAQRAGPAAGLSGQRGRHG